jgi:hypothetical protein
MVFCHREAVEEVAGVQTPVSVSALSWPPRQLDGLCRVLKISHPLPKRLQQDLDFDLSEKYFLSGVGPLYPHVSLRLYAQRICERSFVMLVAVIAVAVDQSVMVRDEYRGDPDVNFE